MSGIFAGETNLTAVYRLEGRPETGQKMQAVQFAKQIGGRAAGAAITYALLGGDAILITCIGEDAVGRLLRDELENTYHIRVMDYAPRGAEAGIRSLIADRTGRELYAVSGAAAVRTEKQAAPGVWRAGEFCFFDGDLPDLTLPWIRAAAENGAEIILGADTGNSGAEELRAFAASVLLPDEHLPAELAADKRLFAGDIFCGAYCYYRCDRYLPPDEAERKAAEAARTAFLFENPREGVLEVRKREWE